VFEHDLKMGTVASRVAHHDQNGDSQNISSQTNMPTVSDEPSVLPSSPPQQTTTGDGTAAATAILISDDTPDQTPQEAAINTAKSEDNFRKRDFQTYSEDQRQSQATTISAVTEAGSAASSSSSSYHRSRAYMEAYNAIIRNTTGEDWTVIGLISTNDNHTTAEPEL
jgi:DNA cross-link repair 1C protein